MSRAVTVSAIVSTYNAEKFIYSRITNLQQQTLGQQLEIIVVNSGSTQDEAGIVQQLKAHDPRIKLVTTAHESLYAAWNRGIEMASGQYVTNANTDDRLCPDALEMLSRALDSNSQYALVYADAYETREEGDILEFNGLTPVKPHWTPLHYGPFSLKRLYAQPFCGAQPMWRRALHDELGGFDPAFEVAGDYEFWLRVARHYPFLYLPQFLGLVLRSQASLEQASPHRLMAELFEIRKRYLSPSAL